MSNIWAILRQRCPRCGQGKVFRSSVDMFAECPHCQLRFEREEGYFLGAMYISYTLSTLFLLILMYTGHIFWPHFDLGLLVLVAGVLMLPFVPAIFRYSRIFWIAIERWAWPE